MPEVLKVVFECYENRSFFTAEQPLQNSIFSTFTKSYVNVLCHEKHLIWTYLIILSPWPVFLKSLWYWFTMFLRHLYLCFKKKTLTKQSLTPYVSYSSTYSRVFFVWVFHPLENFALIKMTPLPMKDCKFLSILGTHGHWAVRVL